MNRLERLLNHPLTAWLVLTVSLVITASVWSISEHFAIQRAQDRFDFQTEEIRTAIRQRMNQYEMVLRSGVGLFDSSQEVKRSEWKKYVATLGLQIFYPGSLGMGFSEVIKPADLARHEAAIRAEGFPDYHVWPKGGRPTYTAIVYIEPFDQANRRAFGFDMYSEPIRHEAMDRARDTGMAAVSGTTRLVQESGSDQQKGVLMYLPVYRNGSPLTTLDQRRAALVGYVYSPFRINDLMQGALPSEIKHISFAMFDGDTTNSDLLYDSHSGPGEIFPDREALFDRTLRLETGGRRWTLYLHTQPGFIPSNEIWQPRILALGGIFISLMLFLYIRSLSGLERKARTMAVAMAANLESEVRQRQEAQAAQRVSEEQLYAAFRSAPLGITEIDPSNGLLRMANPAFCRMLGFSEDELIGHSIVDITHPEDADADLEGLRRLREGSISILHREKRYIRKDGVHSWAEVNAALIRDEQGQPLNTVGVVADINYRKTLESQLAERTNQLLVERDFINAVMETQAALVLVFKPDGQILQFNQACEAATHLDRKIMTKSKQLLLNLFPAEDQAAVQNGIDTLLAGASFVEYESRLIGQQGDPRLIFWRNKALRNADRTIRYIVSTGIDMTEQRNIEVIAREHLEEASRLQRLQTANELATTLAHEINQPLSAIATYAAASKQMLRHLPADADKFAANLDRIGQQAILAGNIIRNLREFVSRGRIEPVPIDLNAVVVDACAMMATMAKRQKIMIELKLDNRLPPVNGVAVHVEQVLLNLLRNACDAIHGANHEGGTITIETKVAARMAHVSVKDTGPGIDAELARRLFAPMQSSKSHGLGVGLSISRRLIEAQDGQLWAENHSPGGHFNFVMPLVE
jgi:PAS domain S-box-containing protein